LEQAVFKDKNINDHILTDSGKKQFCKSISIGFKNANMNIWHLISGKDFEISIPINRIKKPPYF
jgi:hypothetical protein